MYGVAVGLACGVLSAPQTAGAEAMSFAKRPVTTPITDGVDGSRSLVRDLYEPAVIAAQCGGAQCQSDVILYLTAHAAGAFVTRSPSFYSLDRGETWHSLPSATPTGSTRPVGGVHGAEAGMAADEAGRAWLFDAGTSVAPLYGFCGYAAEQCSFEATRNDDEDCGPNVTSDRPWLAYGSGRLLLVANAGTRPDTISSLNLGVYDPEADEITWNFCAVGPNGPEGPPAVSPTGDFAVPQVRGEGDTYRFYLIEGNVHAGVAPDQLTRSELAAMSFPIFPSATCGGRGGNWGFTGFDAAGTLYATTWASGTEFAIAAGPPGALAARTFDAHGPLSYLWISGSQRGAGALVTWSVERGCTEDPTGGPLHPTVDRSDLYAAHVRITNGVPELFDESLVAENVIGLSGDYLGSSLGPDGNGYMAAYSAERYVNSGGEPLIVYSQDGGPTL